MRKITFPLFFATLSCLFVFPIEVASQGLTSNAGVLDSVLDIEIQSTTDSMKNPFKDISTPQQDSIIRSEIEITPKADSLITKLSGDSLIRKQSIKSATPLDMSEKPIRRRITYDKNLVTTVIFDSILALSHSTFIVYSGDDVFTKNLLHSNVINPKQKDKRFYNWPIMFLLFAAALIGFARYLKPYGLRQTLNASFNNRGFLQLIKEQNVIGEWFSYLLLGSFMVVFSLMIFTSLQIAGLVNLESLNQGISVFAIIIVLTFSFYLFKFLGLKFIGFVFKTSTATELYFKNIMLFNQTIGLVLLPLLLYNIFYQDYIVMIITWSVFFILNIFKIYRSIAVGHNASSLSVYYLFLYLCAIEIVPVLLIVKTSANYFQGL
jgi:hypothetical protein